MKPYSYSSSSSHIIKNNMVRISNIFISRISNILMAALNVIFLLVGLGLIFYGISSHMDHSYSSYAIVALTSCQKFLLNTSLILGVFFTVFSLLGLASACNKNNIFLLNLYLILLFLSIIWVIIFMIFLFIVTYKSNSSDVEYRLGDYSHWLRNHFAKGKNWEMFRACLVDSHACTALDSHDSGNPKREDFLKENFSPLKEGCCQPPKECEFKYKNETFWTEPSFGHGVYYNGDTDCKIWSNNQNELCYNCNSCKVGFLTTVRYQWRHAAVALLILAAFKILVFSISCCARRNNSNDKRYPNYRSYP